MKMEDTSKVSEGTDFAVDNVTNRGNSEEENDNEDANAIDDDKYCTQEVLESVFSHLDVKRLKIVRLVSKKWNIEACRSIRKRSCLFLRSQPKELTDLETLLEKNKALALPRISKEVHIVQDVKHVPKSNHNVDQLLKIMGDSSLTITKLGLSLGFPGVWLAGTKVLDRGVSMLRTSSNLITHLVIDSYFCDTASLVMHMTFPSLQSLVLIHQDCQKEPCTHYKCIIDIMNASANLQQLSISMRKCDSTYLHEIMTHSNLKHIQKLNIFVDHVSPDFISVLSSVRIPDLRSLSLDFCWNTEDDYISHTTEFLQVISRFSDTIEHLEIPTTVFQYHELETNFPTCPHLLTLHVDEFKIGSKFLSRLPKLQKLTMDFCYFQTEFLLYESITPMVGVQEISFPGCRGTEQDNRIGITLLCKQFPNAKTCTFAVNKLHIYCEICNSLGFYLQQGQELPPQGQLCRDTFGFQRLKLVGVCSVEEEIKLFSGVTKWRWADVSYSTSLDRGPCLLDLRGLTELDLPQGLQITNGMVQFGLGQLKNLTAISFYWNDTLSVDCVVKFLSTYKRVVIMNCCERSYAGSMEELFCRMATAECGCRNGFSGHFG